MSALHPLKRLNRSPHHAAGRSAAIAFLLWLSVGTHEIKLTEAGAEDTVGPVPATINARDLGARGDGRTDDAPAIQQAINRVSATGGCWPCWMKRNCDGSWPACWTRMNS